MHPAAILFRPLATASWRKLHLAVDAITGEIAAHVLTEGHADDAAQVPALLGQVEGQITTVTADGAYDGKPTYAAAAARQLDRMPDVIIPPRSSAVMSTEDPDAQSPRDRHIQLISQHGRIGWQRATGYGRRNLVETTIGRYKHLIGPKLQARSLQNQQGEAAMAVAALNKMIRVAKPMTVRIV
jgi:transposase